MTIFCSSSTMSQHDRLVVMEPQENALSPAGTGTHALLQLLFRFQSTFLWLEGTTKRFFESPKECFVAKRTAGAAVPTQIHQFQAGRKVAVIEERLLPTVATLRHVMRHARDRQSR
jgi:hypothetical protein